jgi:hypothetical protein
MEKYSCPLALRQAQGKRAASAERHMPSVSLGHYALLSFVVRGRGRSFWLLRSADFKKTKWRMQIDA